MRPLRPCRRQLATLVATVAGSLSLGCGDVIQPSPAQLRDARPASMFAPERENRNILAINLDFGCALDGDGVAHCWGENGVGQAPASRNASSGSFTAVGTGQVSACALRGDGVVECWGLDNEGQAPATRAATTGSFVQLAVGEKHVCAIRTDGVIECWGSNVLGAAPATVEPDVHQTFIKVAVGSSASCAVQSDGIVQCWGDAGAGVIPTRAATGARFVDLTLVGGAVCALSHHAYVDCWGPDGDVTTTGANVGAFVRLSVGQSSHACAVRTDGAAQCWGSNDDGQAPAARMPSSGAFITVAVGGSTSCGLTSHGAVECWGANQSGVATPPSLGSPPAAPTGGSVESRRPGQIHLSWTDEHTSSIGYRTVERASRRSPSDAWGPWETVTTLYGPTTDGGAASYDDVSAMPGFTHRYQLRACIPGACSAPVALGIARLPNTRLSGADKRTCAIRPDGAVECWGDFAPPEFPGLIVPGSGKFVDVAVGQNHGCALRNDGVAQCWGNNDQGQAPATRSAATGTFVQLSVWTSSCAVRTDGVVECWGPLDFGGAPPTQSTTSRFVEVRVGPAFSCGRRGDGSVECWGSAITSVNIPTIRTPSIGSYVQLHRNGLAVCALRTDGVVECWGSPGTGALASKSASTGSFRWATDPSAHSCATRTDGVVECWGENGAGQAPETRSAANGSFAEITVGSVHSCAMRVSGYRVECWGSNAERQITLRTPGVAATGVSGGQIDLSWFYIYLGGSRIEIHRRERDGTWGAWSSIATLPTSVESHSDTDVESDGQYQYRFRVCTQLIGCSDWVSSAPVRAAGVPAAPGDAFADWDGEKVTVVWSDLSDNETSFRIVRRSKEDGIWQPPEIIATVGENVTTFDDPTAVPGGTYRYSIKACRFVCSAPTVSNTLVIAAHF